MKPFLPLLLTAVLLTCLDWVPAFSQQVHYQHISLPEGMPKQIFVEDPLGDLWMGGRQGLFREEQSTWQPLAIPDNFTSREVTAFGLDQQGTVWVGFKSGEMARLQSQQLTPWVPEEGHPDAAITGFLFDAQGWLWYSTYGEGVYYQPPGGRVYQLGTDDGLPSNEVYDLEQGPDQSVWAATDQGIAEIRVEKGKKSIAVLGPAQGLTDALVISLGRSKTGLLLAGTFDAGVFVWNNPTRTFRWLDQTQSLAPVNAIQVMDNRVWLGSDRRGVWEISLFNGRQVQVEKKPGEPLDFKVSDLLLDAEGNLWMGGMGDETGYFPVWSVFFPKPQTDVLSLAHGPSGWIWSSTGSGLFAQKDMFGLPELVFPAGRFGGKQIISLLEDEKGFLWIGTFGNGLYRMEVRTRKLEKINGAVNENVLSIAIAGQTLWLGTLGGLYSAQLFSDNQPGPFVQVGHSGQGMISYVYKVLAGKDGGVYCATDGHGLMRVNRGKLERITPDSIRTIYALTEDGSGAIWLGGEKGRLWKYAAGRLDAVLTSHSLDKGMVASLFAAPEGQLLVVRTEDVFWLNTETGNIQHVPGTKGGKLLSPNLNVTARGPDNAILWAGKGGVHALWQSTGLRTTPLGHLKSILVNLEPHPQDISRLKPHQNTLTFQYEAHWRQAQEKVLYRYRLLGLDSNWTESQSGMVTFSRLRPGTYTFEVKASAEGWHGPAPVFQWRFTVAPPFWQTWWFALLCGMALFGAMTGIVWAREQRLQRENQRQKEKILFEFETLKSQVNPHFLFNTFNTLLSLIDESPESAKEYVNRLSDMFRNLLTLREKDTVTLEEELRFLSDYIYLQQQRYGQNLKVQTDITPRWMGHAIPPMSLQMLIENAIKHNVISRQRPLTIHIHTTEEGMLVVENTLQPKRVPPESTGLGLANIRRRYALLSTRPVEVEKLEDRFVVQVPLLPPTPGLSVPA
jgi:ligand-binding sensor domain-containing protein